MKVYEDPLAYETIQRDVEKNFIDFIGVNETDLLTVVIVGACQGHEIQRFLDTYEHIYIYAFEPVPETFEILENTYKDYRNVICLNFAVSDKSGVVTFHDVSTEGCGSLKEFIDDGHNTIANSFDVDATTLKDVFGDIEIDLLWVDTQGTELDVLKGVTDLNLVKSLFLEVTMREEDSAYKGNCIFNELEEFLKSTHTCHSIGLDNAYGIGTGTGNSFWVHNAYK